MVTDIQIAVISAASALLGSLIGGIISFLTARDASSREWKQSLVLREIEKKETLYSDFIGECAYLLLSAIDEKATSSETFVKLYSLLGKIRMASSKEVNIVAEEYAQIALESHTKRGTVSEGYNVRNRFTEVCREELDEIRKRT